MLEMAESIVKYGIIGVGMMGREHLINLYHLRTHGVVVVAIADPHLPSQQLAFDLARSFTWPLKVLSLPFFYFSFFLNFNLFLHQKLLLLLDISSNLA